MRVAFVAGSFSSGGRAGNVPLVFDHPKPTAVVFPGQGSQTEGLREFVDRSRPDLVDAVRELVGADPFPRIANGTAFAQPAIFCASIAAWSEWAPAADFLAGHSLGELSALVAAGGISEEDGLRLVVIRGRAMQEAAETAPAGGMVALLKVTADEADDLAAEFGVTVANDNAPGEVVVAGDAEALHALSREARRRKLRAIHLAVAGAFHTSAMGAAAAEFRRALDDVSVARPATPVYSSSTAAPFQPGEIRDRLAAAVTAPVRWRETVLALSGAGARRFIDAGPGSVLAGLVRRTLPAAEAMSIQAPEAIHA
jgi:malonyl CoA-acyl carrier protein transacylase